MSPFQDALDVVVCVVMTLLVGWHHVFLPSFLFELLPLGDFAPTWTIAAFIATRGSRVSANDSDGGGQEKKTRRPIQATVLET